MKILSIVCSPRKEGNTAILVNEVLKESTADLIYGYVIQSRNKNPIARANKCLILDVHMILFKKNRRKKLR